MVQLVLVLLWAMLAVQNILFLTNMVKVYRASFLKEKTEVDYQDDFQSDTDTSRSIENEDDKTDGTMKKDSDVEDKESGQEIPNHNG
jgi:hypothetical protein